MQEHKLETRDGKNYCVACQQTWKGKPRSLCPGVRIIEHKSPDFNKLDINYLKENSSYFITKNLRPLTKVCCLKIGKDDYIYYYDPKGKTEKIDPDLPPVLEFSYYYSSHYEDTARDDPTGRLYQSCLKDETGLKKLNLKPGSVKPVAVYHCYSNSTKGNFVFLYNPLDCIIAYKNFPKYQINRIYNIYCDDFDPDKTDLLDENKLLEFNLKPRQNTSPVLAVWNNTVSCYKKYPDWNFYWDIKQCEIDDLSLPPVMQKVPEELYREASLHQLNRQISLNSKPKGCIWENGKFIYLYDPAYCKIIDSNLPPILPYSYFYNQNYERKSTLSCLKSKEGLKTLNLKPGSAEPVAVYFNSNSSYYHRDNFTPLYNPLDCEIYIQNLPPIIDDIDNIPPDLLSPRKLKELNLKPRKDMIGVCSFFGNDWRFYWDIKQCEIDDLTLPVVLPEKPDYLYQESELYFLNRKISTNTKAAACVWKWEKFVYLYFPEDCELINPDLPPCHHKKKIPKGLKSEWGWQQAEPLFELKKNAVAVGCFITRTDNLKEYKTGIKTVLLYDKSSLEIHGREIFLSLTKLKQNYHLSPSLIKKLGKPDKYETNPINEHYAPVKLFSRRRIEKFLEDNAEIYIKHLERRDKYLAIFEANKDKLLSPKSRQKAQETKRLKKKGRLVVDQFNWDNKKRIVLEQSVRCLKCASGITMNGGFFCAINPFGLDLEQIPCQDWQKR